jgi:hypothetical protein
MKTMQKKSFEENVNNICPSDDSVSDREDYRRQKDSDKKRPNIGETLTDLLSRKIRKIFLKF